MNNSIGREAVKLTTARITTLVISMISTMLLSRFLTLEEYGTYSQLLLVVSLMISIFSFGVLNSSNYFLARVDGEKEKREYLVTFYLIITALSVIMGFILVFSTPLLENYFNNSLISTFLYVLAVLPWTNFIGLSIDNVLITYHKTSKLILYRFLNSLALMLIIVMVQIFNLTFSQYMMMFVIVQTCFALWVYVFVGKLAKSIRGLISFPMIKSIFVFSIPLGLSAILGTINVELDKIIIGCFLGTESLALYTNAGKELPITIVSVSVTAVIMPRLIKLLKKNNCSEAIRLWGDTTVLSYIVISYFAIAFFVFAPQVMTFLYSEKYLMGTPVFRIYSLVLLFRTTYFGIILNSIGKTRLIMYSSIFSLLIAIILIYLFFKFFGFVGPAIASFLSIGCIQFAQLYASAKSINISFKKIIPWKLLGIITLVNIIFGITSAGILWWFNIGTSVRDIIIVTGISLIWMLLYTVIMLKTIIRKWNAINSSELF